MTLKLDRYSHIEVAGEAIIPVIKTISADALCKILLTKYDLENIQPEQFCPMKNYLILLHEIKDRMPTVLKKIAELISEQPSFSFPPNISTFEQALMAEEQFYYMNHRGYQEGEIGHILCEKKMDGTFFMTISTPYPCIFDQGVTIGLAKNFGVRISIEHTDDGCRSKGSPQCNYHIRLEE